jgi:hypothetical protein
MLATMSPLIYPCLQNEMPIQRRNHAKMINDFQNSWWYLHREYQSKTKMVYGNIYNLPHDIGQFDVVTLCSILLHLRNPLQAIEQASLKTMDKIVITDTWPENHDTIMANIMRPFPAGEGGRWLLWWLISAGAIVEILKIYGFKKTTVTEHLQLHQPGHRTDIAYISQPMYTVVGER